MEIRYGSPHHQGTPPGRQDVHRFGNSRTVRRQWLIAGVLTVVVAVIGVLVFGLRMFPFSGGAVSAPIGSIPDRDLDSVSGRIAFVSGRDGDTEIYVMNADGSGLMQLTDNEFGDHSPAWSPDGGRITFVSDRDNDVEIYDIYVMNVDGSDLEQVTDGCSNARPVWSPDGGRIAFVSRGDIYVMNADGSGVEQLTGTPHASCAEVFYSDRDGDGDDEAYIRSADGSVERLTDYNSIDWDNADGFPSWLPDGDRIVFQSHRDGDWEIYVMNVDGSDVEQLTDNEYGDWHPSWSLDSGRIAFASDRYSDDLEIYVMNMDGSGVERLRDNEYVDYVPAWSPDGGRIAFSSFHEGDVGIYVMNADGSGVVRLAEGYLPAWSPVLD